MVISLLRGALLGVALLLPAALPALADELRIGMKGVVDSADPHQSYTPNRNVQYHVYEPLVFQDEHLRPYPGLAESWRAVDPLTWEFTLRPGVKFHDGSPLTPQDVAFSLMRARAAIGIRTYASSVRNIVSIEPTGERTFLIHEREPTPLQPDVLMSVAIVSAKAAADATPNDWNGGKAAIGTGPYKWVKWTPGQEVVIERNDAYWGPKEPWDRVVFRFISNDSARVAALLAGDIDIADTLPAELYDRIRTSDKVKLITTDSIFTNYLYIDCLSPTTPNIMGADGKPLPVNPLLDLRVREAMDHAINRAALAERAMQGSATAAGQIAAEGLTGHVADLKPAKYDPALSKKLLAEAGYPNGFTMVLTCTSDRFAGDSRTCQAVGQMLTAVGIKAQVDALPSAIYFRRWATYTPAGPSEFTATISMFGSTTGVGSESMTTILHTLDPERGLGPSNRKFVSDKGMDALLDKIGTIFDAAERDKVTQEAARYAMEHRLVLPLFHVKASWGVRRDLSLVARQDQYTLAMSVRKAQ